MKHNPGQFISLQTRRNVLKAALALPVSGIGGRLLAQTERPMLTRAIPHSGEQLLEDVIGALISGGGKLIDTASTYGNAEEVIGTIVASGQTRDRLFLATKLEVRPAKAAADEFQRSLQRLRTEKVDLIQLHNVSRPNQSLAQLREWKEAGRCRYVGVTTTFDQDYDAMEAIIRHEKPDFVQVDYSMDNRDAEKRIIPAAAEVGAAVLTALPLGRTSLFQAVKGKTFPVWAKDFDADTWAQFFLKFLLSNPSVTAVIPGTGNAQHMIDNLNAGRGRLPDPQQREKMLAVLAS
jgi:aryl-alcohol dehydrogenase-like predicted oxidoreductase